MVLSYEEQRLQNIKDNEALLLSLGLSAPNTKVSSTRTPKSQAAIKSKPKKTTTSRPSLSRRLTIDSIEIPSPRSVKSLRDGGSASNASESPLRRSGRTGTRKDYAEIERRMYEDGASASSGLWSSGGSGGSPVRWTKRARESGSDDEHSGSEELEERVLQRKQARLGVRTQDPHLGISQESQWVDGGLVGWKLPQMPFTPGISGSESQGAYSVALSGGYPDDVDLGEAFTYTGAGGRDLKGTANQPKNLRTAPQTFNQSFDHAMNAALKRSAETRKPVRVIRGFKLDSPYAPSTGYRYDGLYVVERAWMAKGLTKGLLVCRYAFKRMAGQPALPVRSDESVDEEE